jgi:putative iron-regulated protein
MKQFHAISSAARIALLIAVLALNGCTALGLTEEEDDNTTLLAALGLAAVAGGAEATAVRDYANVAYLEYTDAHAAAVNLQTAVNALVANRTAGNLNAARSAWTTARQAYGLTEALRFSQGPIDNPALFSEGGSELEPLINAWPLDEVTITNYIAGAGAITRADLIGANGAGGEEDVKLGWHAIEFLLWGSDAAAGGPSAAVTAADFNTVRRQQYIVVVTDALVDHLRIVRDAWYPAGGSFYVAFTASPRASLDNALTGMATFAGGEWGGERFEALDTSDQENEHSCFSDTTKQDFFYNSQGFLNLFSGAYGTYSGRGLAAIYAGATADQLKSDIASARDVFAANTVWFYDDVVQGGASAERTQLQNVRVLIGQTVADRFVQGARAAGYNPTIGGGQ